MIPRGAPYISWTDLAAAVVYSSASGDADAAQRHVEMTWSPNTVAFLSVRSGLDALLQVHAFPPGTEFVLSAITIPHVLDILAHHGIVAVPVDLDLDTLAINAADVQRAVTSRTRAVLVAHLFGARMPLDEIAAVAHAHGLLLIEDCAQAHDDSGYRGDPQADVSMFSFGSIKRQTALGGALLRCADGALADQLRKHQASYAQQPVSVFRQRIATIAAVKAAVSRPVFKAFVAICRWRGVDHDAALGTALRGFAHGDLFARLRQRPSRPMLRLLSRRLRQSMKRDVERRVAVVDRVKGAYPALMHPGGSAARHRHWLFPTLTPRPDALMHHLWSRGFDATRGASNLTSVPAPAGRPEPVAAQRFMSEVVYLPLFPGASAAEMTRLGDAVREFDDSESLGSQRAPSMSLEQ
jgi:dTDP-4-amino-4,6-dideoxygalactose transaminase